MPRRVLVTRPAPETQRTARRLTELGYEPVMLPLTQTVALPVDAASLPERIDAVAVTSSNALRNASPGLIARLAGKPCFAVGDKTARQALSLDFSGGPGSTESERHPLSGLLRKPPLPLQGRGKAPGGPAGVSSPPQSGGEVAAKRPERGSNSDPPNPSVKPRGFSSVEQGSGDAESLADLVIQRLGAGASVVYLCGRVRLSGFEARMLEAGIMVHAVETYDMRAIDYGQDELSAAIGTEPVDAVLLYSAGAASRFRLLDWPKPTQGLLARAAYLCLSPRVAENLGDVGESQMPSRFRKSVTRFSGKNLRQSKRPSRRSVGEATQVCLVAPEPTETALLRLLEQLGP